MRTVLRQPRKSERGIVLLLTLLALLLISAVGAAILYMAAAESGMVGSQRLASRTFYGAMGGVEEGRYRMLPSLPIANGGFNFTDSDAQIYPCTVSEQANTPVPCDTATVLGGGVRTDKVLYIMNSTAANPAAPGTDATQPASPTNDPFLTAEMGGTVAATDILTVPTNQPNAGDEAVEYDWVRLILKTERASGQDIDFDGSTANDEPIFIYMGRQYRRPDIVAMDPLLCALASPSCALPPPWGPTPPPGVNQNCTSFTCASPVYLVTSVAQIPNTNASRVVQAEVASLSAFLLNAAIVSEPGVDMTGSMIASGRDMCDPDCAALVDTTTNIFANQSNFDLLGPQPPDGPWPTSTVPSVPPNECRYVIPVQSEAPTGAQSPNTAAGSDPYCDPGTDMNCVCSTSGGGAHMPAVTNSCVLANQSPPYDVDNLIDLLRPVARELTAVGGVPAPDYYPQTGPQSNLNCGGSPYECQGQGVELGGFPFADYVNGPADRLITYVPGNFRCTSGCSGAGILIIDGDLELSASMSFWGIIIVRGSVTVLGGGSPATPCNLYGSLITQGGLNPTALGGSICFQYNTCALQRQFSDTPLVRLAFREIPD